MIIGSDDEKTLKAYYIGSDYTYAYSPKFRNTIFKHNTLDQALLIGITHCDPPEQPEGQGLLDQDGQAANPVEPNRPDGNQADQQNQNNNNNDGNQNDPQR